MKSWFAVLFGSAWLILGAATAQAAVPLATPEQDRYAKQALPPSGKALVYVYRLKDAKPQASPGIWLNTRDSGKLDPNTFGMWAVGPGRLEIRAGRVDAMPLTINCEAGQIYFALLAVNADGSMGLSQIPYGKGRAEIKEARFVLDPTLAAARAPVPPVAASAQNAEMVKVAPLAKETPATSSAPQAAVERGVTLTAKIGFIQQLSKNQTIDSASRQLSTSSFIYGLEGEWRHESDFAVSLELFGHSLDYSTTATTDNGDVAFSYAFLNVKKYFRTGTLAQPFIGLGIGRTTASFSADTSGGVSGDADSNAAQAMAGVIFRWPRFDIYTEYKYLHDKFTYGGEVNASGNGLFAGVSWHF